MIDSKVKSYLVVHMHLAWKVLINTPALNRGERGWLVCEIDAKSESYLVCCIIAFTSARYTQNKQAITHDD